MIDSDHGPACPECRSCCADDCKACPGCGHCHDLHGFDGQYCRWRSPAGIACPCLFMKTRAMEGADRWPDDEEEPDAMGSQDDDIVHRTIWGPPGVDYDERPEMTFAEWARTKGSGR
jgi:hypothetical protein